jgi:4-hydroxybenzoate polyprenyltransferase
MPIKSARMNAAFLGLLRLARPANLPTAMADILAGMAIAGLFIMPEGTDGISAGTCLSALSLIAASVMLYAGGVILNDVFDLEIDRIERPERPLPSGMLPVRTAGFFGAGLLFLGVILSLLANPVSALIAVFLTISILLYDAYLKKFSFLGPLGMGVCRSLNLCLGMSLFGEVEYWWFALIPLVYIAAITLISRGEVHGKNKNHILMAALMYSLVICSVIAIWLTFEPSRFVVLICLGLFALMIFKPLLKAYRINSATHIKRAVMAGVLSLIVLDASLAAVFAPWWYGILILLLWPLSKMLSRLFAVT